MGVYRDFRGEYCAIFEQAVVGILISRRPVKESWLRLSLPNPLVPEYLQVVKNIHGRRRDAEEKRWDIPDTKQSLRFIEQYLMKVARLDFKPSQLTRKYAHYPERLGEASQPVG